MTSLFPKLTWIIAIGLLPLCLQAQPVEGTLLGTWDDPDLVGSNAYNNTYNEIWGYAAAGREYAIVGSTAGTHFIDVTDPENPFEAHFVAGAAQGGQIIHRDYHDYNGYLYAVADEGASTLQIIDMTQLPNVVTVPYDSDELIDQSHNIFIDTATAKLYCFAVSGGIYGYSAMRLYDIEDPLDPQFLGEYDEFGGLDAGHVHDGYVRNDLAYLNCGYDGFAIVDFSDPANPVTTTTMTNYPYSGYNHSGWASEDCSTYYLADENHGFKLKVVDVSNPCEIEVTKVFDAEAEATTSIAHNALVACDYLYVSYYYDGLQVYDISDPTDPQRVMYYDTSDEPDGSSYKGAWGVYPYLPSGNVIVLDMQNGLFILEGMNDNCADTREVLDCDLSCLEVSSSTNETLIESLEISPVPARDLLNVNINLMEGQNKVNLYLTDINGRLVQRFENRNLASGTNRLELGIDPQLPAGFYLLRIQGSELNAGRKVVISR